jgi:hypothetical protein
MKLFHVEESYGQFLAYYSCHVCLEIIYAKCADFFVRRVWKHELSALILSPNKGTEPSAAPLPKPENSHS